MPYKAMPAVSKDIAALLKGKVVIDTSNPIPTRDGEVGEIDPLRPAGLAARRAPDQRDELVVDEQGARAQPLLPARIAVGLPMRCAIS